MGFSSTVLRRFQLPHVEKLASLEVVEASSGPTGKDAKTPYQLRFVKSVKVIYKLNARRGGAMRVLC